MQTILPLIPCGSSQINDLISVVREEHRWTYYLGGFPIYSHLASDPHHFRLILAQLVQTNPCRPCQLVHVFGITKNKVLRAVKHLDPLDNF